ncbi:MAG: hypothetical protein ACIAS6_13175 [Phycisphaerales bacterium JB060]
MPELNDQRFVTRPRFKIVVVGFLTAGLLAGAGRLAQERNGDTDLGENDRVRRQQAQAFYDLMAPPVGTVTAWWGTAADIDAMPQYELCDGGKVSTEGSPLFGLTKPDLRDRFVMGVPAKQISRDLRANAITDGEHTTKPIALPKSGGHALTIAQLPAHNHDHYHWVAQSRKGQAANGRLEDSPSSSLAVNGANPGAKDSKYSGSTFGGSANAGRSSGARGGSVGEGKAHSHSLPKVPEHDNRPAFVALHYILRVK